LLAIEGFRTSARKAENGFAERELFRPLHRDDTIGGAHIAKVGTGLRPEYAQVIDRQHFLDAIRSPLAGKRFGRLNVV
jgi:hypothetical protein